MTLWSETIRILIVEDLKENRAALFDRLRLEFPEAQIDTASNLSDALTLALAASSRGEWYHIACLDVKLPRNAAEVNPTHQGEIHPALRKQLLTALGQRTTVLNYTGYYSTIDRNVLARLDEVNAPTMVLIDASPGKEWTKELVRHARNAVYGRRIGRELDRILEAARGRSVGGYAVAAREVGGTHSLGGLIQDIRENWNDLDPHLQQRIRSVFEVEERDGELIVNV